MIPTYSPFGHFFPDQLAAQTPSDVAVIIPTVLRESLYRALNSVLMQDFSGRIQILIGIDRPNTDLSTLFDFLERRPLSRSALVFHPPFSTSIRNGGLHLATDGGSLRGMLTLLANARYVAYLDDDNAWKNDHVAKVYSAIKDRVWAFAHRMLVKEEDLSPVAVDRWDSVGPNLGRFKEDGGFVDPNCLLIDKLALANELGRWADSGIGKPAMTADRNFFQAIKAMPYAEIPEPTVLYTIRKSSIFYQFIANQSSF